MKKVIVKIKEFIEKKDNIFMAVLIVFATLGITLNIFLVSDDELWCFQHVFKMYNGLKIYSDVNVITTPLFFMIGEVIFNILNANILSFRIYNIIIVTILYFFIYLILKKIGIAKKYSVILIILLMIINNYSIIRCQANYNVLALALYIIGIYVSLKKSKYNSIFQGIICFFIYFIKQNIAIYYMIGLIFYEIIINKKIKEIFIEISTFLLLVVISLITMKYTGHLDGFINYTILGIKEFALENVYVNWFSLLTTVIIVGINMVFTIFFTKKKMLKNNEKNELVLLNSFAYPAILISVPIMNSSHALIGLYVSIILLVYIMRKVLIEVDWKPKENIINTTMLLVVFLSIGYSFYHLNSWNSSIKKYEKEYGINEKHPFYGGIFQEGFLENVENVTRYIENSQRNVIVFSNKAALYMIPLKKNNGVFDLPNKGNFGKERRRGNN